MHFSQEKKVLCLGTIMISETRMYYLIILHFTTTLAVSLCVYVSKTVCEETLNGPENLDKMDVF